MAAIMDLRLHLLAVVAFLFCFSAASPAYPNIPRQGTKLFHSSNSLYCISPNFTIHSSIHPIAFFQFNLSFVSTCVFLDHVIDTDFHEQCRIPQLRPQPPYPAQLLQQRMEHVQLLTPQLQSLWQLQHGLIASMPVVCEMMNTTTWPIGVWQATVTAHCGALGRVLEIQGVPS